MPPDTTCKACHAPILWRLTKNRAHQPMNPDGTPHHATCPHREAFRRLKRPHRRPPPHPAPAYRQGVLSLFDDQPGEENHHANDPPPPLPG